MPYGRSTIVSTGADKLSKLSGAFAVQIARQKNDPLYTKLIKLKKMYRIVKKQILQKYGAKGKMAARLAASKHH